MLTDKSINYPQNILHEPFPNVPGLEDTTLGLKLNFSIRKEEFARFCTLALNFYGSLYGGVITNHV